MFQIQVETDSKVPGSNPHSEVEMLGDVCCLQNRTERDVVVPKNWY